MRDLSRNIIKLNKNIDNIDNFDYTIERRLKLKEYFTLYKPYSINDIDLIKNMDSNNNYNINNIKGILDKNRKYYYIAKGGSGVIYGVLIPFSNELVWISIKITKVIKNKLNNNELLILNKCNKIIYKTHIQNLPISFGYRMFNKDDTPYIFLYNELAYANLEDWIKDTHDEQSWKSFFFQLWFSLHTLQTYMNLVHNDLRLPNILYHTVTPGGYWKYIINDIEYYVPNCGYVFYIWDFGSAESDKISTNNITTYKEKLNNNIDLIYIHALIDRIKVLILTEKYSLDDISNMFVTNDDKKIFDYEYKKNKARFDDKRFPTKFKLSLIYYLIEHNKFDNFVDPKLPINIMNLLEQLKKEDNLSYDQIQLLYNKPPIFAKAILSPSKLIEKYLSEFKKKQQYTLSFELLAIDF